MLAGVTLLPGVANGGPLSFSVLGTGGVSPPVAGFSESSFAWVDNTGAVAGSAFGAYGFNPVPGVPSVTDDGVGSLMLSSAFSMNDGDLLSVSLSVLTASEQKGGYGFALLLEDSQLRSIIANVRPDGRATVSDQPHPPQYDFVGTSPGVVASY